MVVVVVVVMAGAVVAGLAAVVVVVTELLLDRVSQEVFEGQGSSEGKSEARKEREKKKKGRLETAAGSHSSADNSFQFQHAATQTAERQGPRP